MYILQERLSALTPITPITPITPLTPLTPFFLLKQSPSILVVASAAKSKCGF